MLVVGTVPKMSSTPQNLWMCYVTQQGRIKTANQLTSRIMQDYPGLDTITRFFTWGRREQKSQNQSDDDHYSWLSSERPSSAGARNQGLQQTLEAGKARKLILSEPPERIWLCQYLDFSLRETCFRLQTLDCKLVNLFCIKPLSL